MKREAIRRGKRRRRRSYEAKVDGRKRMTLQDRSRNSPKRVVLLSFPTAMVVMWYTKRIKDLLCF